MYCGHQKQKEQHSVANKEDIFLATNKTRTNKAKITSRKRTKKSKNSGFQQICTHTSCVQNQGGSTQNNHMEKQGRQV